MTIATMARTGSPKRTTQKTVESNKSHPFP